MKRKRREVTSFEKSLMRGLRLKNVRQLDKLWAAPISQWAEAHSELPDEEEDLHNKAIEYLERQMAARERFNALSQTKYVN